VLTEAAGFFVIDIDGALQPDGKWSERTLELWRALPGTVAEISQSGRGWHLWGRTRAMPPHRSKNTALQIECYHSRRFILLGTHQAGTMAEDCPAIVDVVGRYFPPSDGPAVAHADGRASEWSGPEDDDELIALMHRMESPAARFGGGASFADLWAGHADALARHFAASGRGDGRPYDASSADASLAQRLAYFTGRDTARMERLMRRSGLMREKFDRVDYLPRTIANACKLQREVLQQKRPAQANDATPTAQPDGSLHIAPQDPVNTARAFASRTYRRDGVPTLREWQGQFYQWRGGAWVELAEPDVTTPLYGFIERHATGFKAKRSIVSDAMHALRHLSTVHLESTIAPPAWLDGAEGPPASELVACTNGLLHLPTGELKPATPNLFNLNALPVAFDPAAPLPARWLQFLGQVWPNDPEAIATLQELAGYLLTPDTSQQKLFLIVGPKRSGKGTIARVLTALLGPANVASPTLGGLAKDFGLQPLVGKLAAVVSDARLSGRPDQREVAEHLLRISGEDQVEVNRKFLAPLALRLGVRFVLLTNELPRIADASGAMASRFVILTMSESFYGREDPALTGRLLAELPSILAWAVQGWHRLRQRGYFTEPQSSAEAARELADLGSPVGAFVREECHTGPTASVKSDELFAAWQHWCAKQGTDRPGSKIVFARDLIAAFPSITQGRPRTGEERERVYRGIGLRGPGWAGMFPIAGKSTP